MESQANLGFLQFAEIAIRRCQPLFQTVSRTEGQLDRFEPLGQHAAQSAGALPPQLGRLPILIQQRLQLLEAPMQAGPTKRRGEMVEDYCLGPAFGLAALAGIVDDKGIEMGHRAQGPFREAVPR